MPIEYPIDFIHRDGSIFRVESPADAAPYKSSVSPRHVEVTRVWDGERAAIFVAKHDWIVRDALGRPVGREDIPSPPTSVSRRDRQRQAAQRAAALKLPIPRTGKNKLKRKGRLRTGYRYIAEQLADQNLGSELEEVGADGWRVSRRRHIQPEPWTDPSYRRNQRSWKEHRPTQWKTN